MARLTGNLGGQIVFDQTLAMFGSRCRVYPTGNVVEFGGVAADAVEILAVRPHVNIEGFVGLYQG